MTCLRSVSFGGQAEDRRRMTEDREERTEDWGKRLLNAEWGMRNSE